MERLSEIVDWICIATIVIAGVAAAIDRDFFQAVAWGVAAMWWNIARIRGARTRTYR